MREVPKKLRKKMDHLLDDKFIMDFLNGNLKIFFEGAKKIKSMEKIMHKEARGNHDYTLVIEFILQIYFKNKKIIEKSVFCKAHSSEKKNKSPYYMEFLYKNGFNEGLYQVPRPLIYLPEFRAGFYEGVKGHNLLYYLKLREYDKIKTIVKDAAHWISKLHLLDPANFASLQIPHTKIKDNQPPAKQVLTEMKKNYNRLYLEFYPLYKQTRVYESRFLKTLKIGEKTKIIYADYHPENIIIPQYAQQGVTVIDFTDLAIGDQFRDIGTFMEQIAFMSRKYMPPSKGKLWQKIFLEEYIKINKLKLTHQDWQRINLYRLWTTLRNIIYFYYKNDPNQVIWSLIDDAKMYLNLIKNKSCKKLKIN